MGVEIQLFKVGEYRSDYWRRFLWVKGFGHGASLSRGEVRRETGGRLLYKDPEEYVEQGSGNGRLAR
jgi:hypothetical protein